MSLSPERIKKLINENQDLFLLLEDLDKTGKLRKLRYKARATFTLDEELFRQFRKYCLKNKLEMSPIVEEFIAKFIKEKPK